MSKHYLVSTKHLEKHKNTYPFRDIEVGDRVVCIDETYTFGYGATVITIRNIQTARFVLRFDNGEKAEYDDGEFGKDTYCKEWWFMRDLYPFRDIEVGDRVVCIDETYTFGYGATVITIRNIQTARFVLRFDNGEKAEYDDGEFGKDTYCKEWWFVGKFELPELNMEYETEPEIFKEFFNTLWYQLMYHWKTQEKEVDSLRKEGQGNRRNSEQKQLAEQQVDENVPIEKGLMKIAQKNMEMDDTESQPIFGNSGGGCQCYKEIFDI